MRVGSSEETVVGNDNRFLLLFACLLGVETSNDEDMTRVRE